jgi:hypothetical protein
LEAGYHTYTQKQSGSEITARLLMKSNLCRGCILQILQTSTDVRYDAVVPKFRVHLYAG